MACPHSSLASEPLVCRQQCTSLLAVIGIGTLDRLLLVAGVTMWRAHTTITTTPGRSARDSMMWRASTTCHPTVLSTDAGWPSSPGGEPSCGSLTGLMKVQVTKQLCTATLADQNLQASASDANGAGSCLAVNDPAELAQQGLHAPA